MSGYRHFLHEPIDDYRIVGTPLNRPGARNAQHNRPDGALRFPPK